ncbi:MAG: hypothetical protein CMC08_07280 [Flavobacteriaceae bacterium]|mgnify:CR=1 FL=1|nr:hypothetical protein [Flavobacteriaceae bacterium]
MKLKHGTLGLLALFFIACGEMQNPSAENQAAVSSAPRTMEKSTAELKKELTDKGFQVFEYVDEATGDTVLMQQYLKY